MSEQDDLLARHQFQVIASMTGYSWVCPCGKSSGPDQASEQEAQRDGERHVLQALGLQGGPNSEKDQELGLLIRLHQLGRRTDPSELKDFGSYPQVMSLLESLHKQRLVEIATPLYGDNRLMSARGVTLSPSGAQEVRKAILAGLDILVSREPDTSPRRPLLGAFDDLEAKRQGRALFMDALYRETAGSASRQTDARDLGVSLGWTPALTADVIRYLTDERLVDRGWGSVALTHAGVVEVEELLENPDSKTRHFSPITNNVYVFGDNTGQIQAGTTGSHQTQLTQQAAAIEAFLDALEQALAASDGDTTTAALVQANVVEVREAIAYEGPDAPRVRRLMPLLRDFGLNIAASGAFLGLTEAAANLPPFG